MSKAYRIINVGKGILNLTAANIQSIPAIIVGSEGVNSGILDGGGADDVTIENVYEGGGA